MDELNVAALLAVSRAFLAVDTTRAVTNSDTIRLCGSTVHNGDWRLWKIN